jgi:hypothetical protein
MTNNGPPPKSTSNWGYELACSTCLNVFRCESIAFPLEGPHPKFCPYCGSTGESLRITHDSQKDYWYILAESLGLPYNKEGAQIAADIFDSWDHEEFGTLREYVHALRTTG